jgi:hypothetical protein
VRITFASLIPAALLAATLTSGPLAAQDCAGDPGYALDLPDVVPLGSSFTISMTAPGNSLAFLLVGGSDGPIPTKYGPLCVGAPLIAVYAIPMPPSGMLELAHNVPCDPALDGATGFFQFVALGPAQGQAGRSNSQQMTAVDDGSCSEGNFVTYTQGGWGTECHGNNPGCLRDAFFETALPNGLLLGDQGGIDGDNHYALLLTSSHAVEVFLPEGGPSSTFDLDQTDVANATAGNFAGQLASAKLSLAFDDAGAFDAVKGQTAAKLGDLVFATSVPAELLGWSLRDVIALADRVISGELATPIDVDNDGDGDVTLGNLASAMGAVNENFDNGTQNNGVLVFP